MLSLSQKIEEIRRKPEQVRLYYVWGLVAFSMAVIVVIWFFSIQENFRSINLGKEKLPDVNGLSQGFQENVPSMNNIQKNLEESIQSQDSEVSKQSQNNSSQESISNLKNDSQNKK